MSKIDESEIGLIVNKCIIRNYSARYNNDYEIVKDISALNING